MDVNPKRQPSLPDLDAAALSAAPQPVAVEPLTAKEDAALLWLGSVRDNFRRMADEANNLLTQACSRLAASSPQEKERG